MPQREDEINPYQAPRIDAPGIDPRDESWSPPTLDPSRAIRTVGRYTRSDCLRAIRLWDRSAPRTWWQWFAVILGIPVVGIVAYLVLTLSGLDPPPGFPIMIALGTCLVLASAVGSTRFRAWLAWRPWMDQPIRRCV